MIMQSWRWSNPAHVQLVNVFLVTVPATVVFAFIFFWFCEKPFMNRRAAPVGSIGQVMKFAKEGFSSRASLTTLRLRFNAYLRRRSHTSEPDTNSATGTVGAASRLANTYADSIAVADSQN
jgi:hypothetical protein